MNASLQLRSIVFYGTYYKMLIYFQYNRLPNHHYDNSYI